MKASADIEYLRALVPEMRALGVLEYAGTKLGPPPVPRSQEPQNDPQQDVTPPPVRSATPGLVPRDRNSD